MLLMRRHRGMVTLIWLRGRWCHVLLLRRLWSQLGLMLLMMMLLLLRGLRRLMMRVAALCDGRKPSIFTLFGRNHATVVSIVKIMAGNQAKRR